MSWFYHFITETVVDPYDYLRCTSSALTHFKEWDTEPVNLGIH